MTMGSTDSITRPVDEMIPERQDSYQPQTPNEMPADQRCGKVVFSDMHVAGDSFSSGMFPSGCSMSPMSPQEKALAFMFFDIASCVQVIQ